ncbi:MAG: LysM peptidoglycan-binding domain-containing protein [Gammaproteobacteria bacterium]
MPTVQTPGHAKAGVTTVTHAPDDLWRRVGIELTMSASGRAAADPLSLFNNSTVSITAAAENARPFLAHIVAALEERQLPLEIALIPIVESTYNPQATSPAGAAGLWQLMPATARRFHIAQNRWYDGRRDLFASTAAALDYMENLRDRFLGDWLLVFAAYNCGERTVERAIERNRRAGKPTDFFHLDLPRATQAYVPRLLALVEIIAHPQAYGIELAKIDSETGYALVDAGPGLDLDRIIEWSAMSAGEFDHLNAAYRKRFTVEGLPTNVLVPRDRLDLIARELQSLDADERGAPREYIVQPGDTLSHIAAASGVPVAVLKHANKLRGHHLAIGQQLLLPSPGETAALQDELSDLPLSGHVHVVVNGDNLWDLSRRYNTTVKKIAAANEIRPATTLRLGQSLLIPGQPAQSASLHKARSMNIYQVRRGDSLWTISQRFKITVADLKAWNDLRADAHLQPGQTLRVNDPASGGNQGI